MSAATLSGNVEPTRMRTVVEMVGHLDELDDVGRLIGLLGR